MVPCAQIAPMHDGLLLACPHNWAHLASLGCMTLSPCMHAWPSIMGWGRTMNIHFVIHTRFTDPIDTRFVTHDGVSPVSTHPINLTEHKIYKRWQAVRMTLTTPSLHAADSTCTCSPTGPTPTPRGHPTRGYLKMSYMNASISGKGGQIYESMHQAFMPGIASAFMHTAQMHTAQSHDVATSSGIMNTQNDSNLGMAVISLPWSPLPIVNPRDYRITR